jgi:hypothetical protein
LRLPRLLHDRHPKGGACMDGTPNPETSPGGLRLSPDNARLGAAKAAHRENKGSDWGEDLATSLQVIGNAEPKNGPVTVPAERDIPTATISNALSWGVPAQEAPPGLKMEGSGCCRGF